MIFEKTIARKNGAYEAHKANGIYGAFGLLRVLLCLVMFIVHCSLFNVTAQAQTGRIKIGGNVYGGGNQGDVKGNSTVNVRKGDAEMVFGGARMANVGGRSLVNIDGEHASGDIMLTAVYGGNDIAGTIGQSGETTTVPIKTLYTAAEATAYNTAHGLDPGDEGYKNEGDVKEHGLTNVIPEPTTEEISTAGSLEKARKKKKEDNPQLNIVDNTWKTFIVTSRSTETKNGKTVEKYPIIIGTLYGGGNGAYYYKKFADDDYRIYLSEAACEADENSYIAKNTTGFNVPEVPKTYLEIKGGCIAHLYGGGNNATVTENTTINIANESDDLESQITAYAKTLAAADPTYSDDEYKALTFQELQKRVKLNTFQADQTNYTLNFARVFGGNNKADMSIRPTWNLQKGKIRDLYSGGNEGRMTSPDGLLLEIDPVEANKDKFSVTNVFGGCRMSDVCPTQNGVYTPCTNLRDEDSQGNQIYKFPDELSARTLVRGGHINNVYGGNDITGKVYGGNAVGIYTTIYGDVYGGGNGAYAYTDNTDFKDDPIYGDYWYDMGSNSLAALNDHRPDAEQVSIRLAGKTKKNDQNQDVPDYTIIQGSVYCGGNCATLISKKKNSLMELKMGSYVIADKVFLGNNGEKMVDDKILELYAKNVDNAGNVEEVGTEGSKDYSSLTLTDADDFADYMEGVAMDLQPDVVFDEAGKDPAAYVENSSYVGSFFCGGNVGSMSIPGKNTYDIEHGLNIFEKFVGGCNNANVKAKDGLCAAYEGGILGAKDERGNYSDEFYTDTKAEDGKIKDRLEINLANLTITPLRWNDTKTDLIWNTSQWNDEAGGLVEVPNSTVNEYIAIKSGTTLKKDEKYYTKDGENYTEETVHDENGIISDGTIYKLNDQVRLLGGNVYGGCYNSGHVNGNVTININEDVLKKEEVFGRSDDGFHGYPSSGVELEDQRDDLNSVALIVFGGGYGEDSEVWGSTTVNLNKGYAFQICGGGEMGIVGKPIGATDEEDGTLTRDAEGQIATYALSGKVYQYDPRFSSTVNLNGTVTATSNEGAVTNLAETEYIYGGGKEGLVCGNTLLNLGNGRLYDAFAGACEADILGHSEAYIGRQPNGSGGYVDAFPWIQDNVYGGNDFTGTIYGKANFKGRVREDAFDVLGKVHNPGSKIDPDVLMANAYVEYLQGRVDTIYGGSYGFYNYSDPILLNEDGSTADLPSVESTFVNIRPNNENRTENAITALFGGGTGSPNNREGDRMQDRSYVLIDIPDDRTNFETTEVFGSGSYNGLGMNSQYDPTTHKTLTFGESPTEITDLDNLTAIVDLMRGKVGAAYGGSFKEGVTRRTMVNVPSGSTIQIGSIFGGGYGDALLRPCDVYEAHVNYSSTGALLIYNPDYDPDFLKNPMKGAIYGGNNNCRRTLYGIVDINSNVRQRHPEYKITRANVYGAGCGPMTWSEYTEVNLNDHAEVNQVYGGAQNGEVLNAESATAFMNTYLNAIENFPNNLPNYLKTIAKEKNYTVTAWRDEVWPGAWTLGEGYYIPYSVGKYSFNDYVLNEATNLSNPLARTAEMDDREPYNATTNPKGPKQAKKYNTNVIIKPGALVARYAYGGGLGDSNVGTGDVYGTTYIALLGGEVNQDIFAAGTSGVVYDFYNSNEFIASSNAYIKGGMVRNVYGGGWEGSVGKHSKIDDTGAEVPADITDPYTNDVYGETHVVIGEVGDDKTFANGKPAITRNVYGGGEGGSVWGTTNLTINNGMIGYRWKNTGTEQSPVYDYVPELDDQKPNDIDGAGNAFGGGYVVNSYVDHTNIKMYGGQIRGSLFGGGEVGPIGGGTTKQFDSQPANSIKNGDATIFRAGKTNVKMYNGHVLRNVFGGGRGQDSWGGNGTKFMDDKLVASLEADGLFCAGYVFGQTEVNIYGGEVGTDAGMAQGFGNVFGGCDEGTVISAYENADGVLCYGEKIGVRYGADAHDGYYFKKENGAFLTVDGHNVYTEDCKVLVEPWLQVKTTPITYPESGGKTYQVGDYIPTAYLNTLGAKNGSSWPSGWDNVDVGTATNERGIVIHNAVFAGGNIAMGSNSMNANETTVFGNATASIHDVYNRDFITIGTGHTGGLYGDGNLTFVDGYRELNITNYGTDKYHLAPSLSIAQYELLPEREKAYYEPKYQCAKSCTDNENTTYKVGSELPYDELTVLFLDENGQSLKDNGTDIMDWNDIKKEWVPKSSYWIAKGVVSTYAGRIMNTIQRADFCGVFGSRMVMKGARDRVPEKEDSKLYTINRVREVSLNKMDTKAGDTGDDLMHGNYFGIYSNVNYFGSLTSDVDFYSTRTTSADLTKYPDLKPNATNPETFEGWKALHKSDRMRNNGSCHNQLALASGVYLELTTEKSTGNTIDKKDWGLITGVVELDLINVQTGVSGGYVYAKNEHGERKKGPGYTHLTALNEKAVSKWDYDYKTPDSDREEWETSGNFIHSSQTIIDDCYNESARYLSTKWVPAHYWFISGSVYVYDQYITAHTGSPNAYSETVELPITIYAASNGKMTLMDVQPNLYAYYSSYTNATTNTKLTGENKVVVNNVEYHLNDPISYWDWYKLPLAERKLFVEDTYVVKEDCKIGTTPYTAGTVLLKGQYDALIGEDPTTFEPVYPTVTHVREIEGVEQDVAVLFTDVFRSSNNMSHNTGYILTYDVTNPEIWKPWYTERTGDSRTTKITTAEYDLLDKASTKDDQGNITKKGQDAYYDGPTYTLKSGKSSGLYGQRQYEEMDIIPENVYNTYIGIDNQYIPNYNKTEGQEGYDAAKKQATFVPAYLVTKEYVDTSNDIHYYPGAPVGQEISGYTSPAYVCTSTIQLSATKFIYVNDLMTETEILKLKADYPALVEDIDELIVPAYYCSVAGLYGGDVYESGKNYRALAIWSSMSEAERNDFDFNYDALDLLIDPTYGITHPEGVRKMQKEGQKYQYDGDKSFNPASATDAQKEKMIYSLSKPIDYTATYNGAKDNPTALTYTDASENSHTVNINQELTRVQYESLPNEQRHYAPITIQPSDFGGETSITIYVVQEDFVHIETPYAVGATLSSEEYTKLRNEEKESVIPLTFSKDDLDHTTTVEGESATTTYNTTTFYYCRELYLVNEKGMGRLPASLNIEGATGGITHKEETITEGESSTVVTYDWVQKGTIINNDDYELLPNKQKDFTIHGKSPMETSTLYVSRQSDINDLSTEKIITVIYKYDYEESDVSGLHVTPVSERHIVNIHIRFESGVPIVEDIKAPTIVLPGTSITMRVPNVTPGAYEITGGGWEIFEKDSYAENHTNGVSYKPSSDPLYWYQDGFLLAYYAKTYLGKTYSNAVPISVANYHDLKKVMDDKEKHLHVDYDRTKLKRESKIYINDYTTDDPATSQNGLNLLKDFYDLSLLDKSKVSLDAKGLINKITDSEGNVTETDSPFKGHALLNTDIREINGKSVMVGVKGGENLEFFLRTDLAREDDPAVANEWTPIASGSDPCFNGTLHGDGHTISGLDNSLFGHLCGNVYNLGVSGSFNTAGVADEGDGYVESCWVKTSGTPASGVKAVFGGSSSVTHEQTVNSYYPESNAYDSSSKAKSMPDKAFYNGTVAYDLNNFYLYKRYNDHENPSGVVSYKYWYSGETEPRMGTYAANAANCSSGYNGIKYVEDRFLDGDFRFAAGEIPDAEDERHYVETTVTTSGSEEVTTKTDRYYPIWPDDYFFFGQKLTYGYSVESHQDVPSAIAKSNERLSQTTQANRVYRAPAYYRSKAMGVVHFNPNAYLPQKEKLTDEQIAAHVVARDAYPDMTAIDFAGHQGANEVNGTYGLGLTAAAGSVPQCFYPPLLDDDGLQSIVNQDETDNLLVYAPAAVSTNNSYANAQTLGVLNSYFAEPAYSDYYDNTGDAAGYRIVRANTSSIHGHLVQSNLTATNDHKLVDKMDFNAPIAYTFDGDHRMWYQRIPDDDEFVDHTKGWQGISIPFTAELVTTNQKGEITHFYSGSETSKNSDKKIGHEYWLRELRGIKLETGATETAIANFNYPDATGDSKDDKNATNKFLWNYYYSKNNTLPDDDRGRDEHEDFYQKYYKDSREYKGYPLLATATPYLIGFPGYTYYEFDLSGTFIPKHTYSAIAGLKKQTITFASKPGITIGVSDDEMTGVEKTLTGTKDYTFTFKPNYLTKTLTTPENFTLDDAGDSYDQVMAETTVLPFRPYFIATATSHDAKEYKGETRAIVFSMDDAEIIHEEGDDIGNTGELIIRGKSGKIFVTSTMQSAKEVTIVTAAGALIDRYTIQPGETKETPINASGVYLVNKKKISVKIK